jgi:hypothetical protein
MSKTAQPILAAIAALACASAHAADEPKWLRDARAREGKPLMTMPIRSKDQWFKVTLPAKSVGVPEKSNGSYSLELDIGGDASIYCEVFPEGFDSADTLRRSIDATMEQVTQAQGKVEMRAMDATDAGAIGNVPYLRTDWIYRVNDGKEARLGAVKQFTLEKDGVGIYCAHVDIGFTKTFDNLMRAFATTFQAPPADSGTPYYTEIATAMIAGHKVGYVMTTLTRDGEGDTAARQMFALLLPNNAGQAISQDSIHKEWIHPDGSLINAIHVVANNGELDTNLSLKQKDERWIIAGDHRGKAVSNTLAPDAKPRSWVAQAFELRKIFAGANAIGAEQTMSLWATFDPTKLTDTKVKVLAKKGAKSYSAQAAFGTASMKLTLDELGMISAAEMQLSPQAKATVTMERVYVNGTF